MSVIHRRAPPAVGPDPRVVFPAVGRSRLATGLSVWTVARDRMPVVTVTALVRAGSASDPPGQAGLASLTADMLDEGAAGRSAIEIQEALARIGTGIDTEAGPDAVMLSIAVLPRHLDAGMALLSDMIMRPRIAGTDFERVRTLRLNRLRQLRDSPGAVADQAFGRTLYGAHPYGHPPSGITSAIERIRVEDVARLHGSAYRPSSATVIAVGAASHDELVGSIERAFGTWRDSPAAGPSPEDDTGAEWPSAGTAPRIVLVDRPGAAQTELRIGHLAAPRRTPDYHTLVVLNAVLGGQFVSRINLNLRERKGYTYGAHTGFDFRLRAGAFVLRTSVQTGATADAVRESIGEIAAIRSERPPTEQELDLGRAALTRGYPRNFEATGQIARALSQLALYDLPDDTFDTFAPAIGALRVGDLKRAALTHLDPDRLSVVAVGDRARIAAALAALDRGDPIITLSEI